MAAVIPGILFIEPILASDTSQWHVGGGVERGRKHMFLFSACVRTERFRDGFGYASTRKKKVIYTEKINLPCIMSIFFHRALRWQANIQIFISWNLLVTLRENFDSLIPPQIPLEWIIMWQIYILSKSTQWFYFTWQFPFLIIKNT